MKSLFASIPSLRILFVLALAFAGILREVRAEVTPQLNPDQLDQLLGPIALYPDALVALILPASTVPADLVLAQRYLSAGGDPERIDYELWNDSVKGLARYPMLIQWLDENLTWTQQLGNAFLNQPDAVMQSVQRLRARARANGTLTSTPQQKLVLDGDVIEIVPAQPDVIYVPSYDPNEVYGAPVYYGGPPYVTFGVGFAAGYWLANDFNWHSHVIVVGDRHHNWYEHHDWNHHSGSGGNPNYGNNWHPWTPPANRPQPTRPEPYRPNPGVAQPRPYPGSPSYRSQPGRPRPDSSHAHPSGPPTNPGGVPAASDQAPPSNHGPRPQPRQTLPPPSSGPLPPMVTNPHPDTVNLPTPSRPSNGGPPMPQHQPQPPPGTNYPQPSRPPHDSPHPASPPPSPQPVAPPPAPKDAPRDDKPEVQR